MKCCTELEKGLSLNANCTTQQKYDEIWPLSAMLWYAVIKTAVAIFLRRLLQRENPLSIPTVVWKNA